MIGKRTKQPVAVEAEPAEDQVAETVPVDLAAAAEQLRREALQLQEEIAQDGANAQAELDEIQRQVAGLQAKAKSVSVTAGAERTAKERRVRSIDERAGYLEHADSLRGQAEEDEQRAAELASEQEHLTEKIAGFDVRLAELQAEGQQAAADLAVARESADLDAMTSLRNRADSIGDLVVTLGGLRKAAQHRADQLGDGSETVPGELLDALTAAEQHRTAITVTLDELYPDRPGAHARRALDNLKNTLEANLARIAGEAADAQRKPQQRVVRL